MKTMFIVEKHVKVFSRQGISDYGQHMHRYTGHVPHVHCLSGCKTVHMIAVHFWIVRNHLVSHGSCPRQGHFVRCFVLNN